ncbi:hypothetical protein Lser_V15G18599 [Lactuca serriola]
MSRSDNYGLSESIGKVFPHEDDIPQYHTSLPPLPPIILPDQQARRLDKFKVTQVPLAKKHQDGKSICAHVLDMKLDINRLRMLGVVVPRKLDIGLVLQSLPKSYNELVKDYYMTDDDITLIDLAYLLIATESAMIWRNDQANMIERSTSQATMNIGNDIDSPKMIPSPKGMELAMIKSFDHKRKAGAGIVSCTNAKEAICFYCHLKGHWKRCFPDYLKDLRDSRIKKFDSASEKKGSLKEEQVDSDREKVDYDRIVR